MADSWEVQGRTKKESLIIVRHSASEFDLGKVKEIQRIGGNANENYFVVTTKGEFIIKIIVEHPKENVEKEVEYIERLKAHKFPIVLYHKLPSGKHILEFNDVIVVVLEKIKGDSPKVTLENIELIGKFFAKLHKISFKGLPKRKNWLTHNYIPDSIELIQKDFPDEAKRIGKSYSLLKDFDHSVLPQGIIHGDMSPENCLFENGMPTAFLDWEETGISAVLLDLATCISNFCFNEKNLDIKRYKAMILGYEKIRPLKKEEKVNLVNAIRYVGLTLSTWRVLKFGIDNPNKARKEEYSSYWEMDLDNLVLPDF